MLKKITQKARTAARVLGENPTQFMQLVKQQPGKILAKPTGHAAKVIEGPPRILIDVTITRWFDYRTGIQRVVKSLTAEMLRSSTVQVQPVYLGINTLRDADDFATGRKHIRNSATRLHAGDNLLMLDSSWTEFKRFETYFEQIREGGGNVYTVIYDLIPFTNPEFFDDVFVGTFTNWFKAAVAKSDGLICISQSVADEAIRIINDLCLSHRQGLKVGFFHLGADIPHTKKEDILRQKVKAVFTGTQPVLLMVGTLEPRKRHEDALAAMEELWSQDHDAILCVIGKYGWKTSHIADRIRTHPETGRRLFWIEDASDAEVQFAYRSASALLFPTWAEGYGLPLIEAAYFGLPVLCSDLPVLREIGGEHAAYFPRGNSKAIANTIRMFISGEAHIDPAKIKRLTWEESAQQLLGLMHSQSWYATL